MTPSIEALAQTTGDSASVSVLEISLAEIARDRVPLLQQVSRRISTELPRVPRLSLSAQR